MNRQRTGAPVAGPFAACLAAAALFGATTPAAKALLADLGPFTAAGLLYLGAGLAAWPFAFTRRKAGPHADPAQRRQLAGAIIAGGGVAPVLLLMGLHAAPAASVSLWLALELPATALLAWIFFSEHFGVNALAATALSATAGLVLASPGGFQFAWAGLLLAGAAIAWGLDNNLTARVDGYTPARYTFLKGLFAGSVNLAIGLAADHTHPAGSMISALVVGALGYGGSLLLYVGASQRLGAVRAQVLFATSPVFGVALAWSWLREPVGGIHLVAAALLGAAVALLLTERHSHRHAHPAAQHAHRHRHDDGHHTHRHPGLPASASHVHPHRHAPLLHAHAYLPDIHHRHAH